MRTMFKAIVFGFGIWAAIISGSVVAEEATASKIDLEKVQRDLVPLAQAFDVPAPAVAAADPKEHKTVGDAADRALDILEQTTAKVAETLKNIAPEVWRIMVKQQYAKAIASPIPSLGFLLASVLFAFVLGNIWTVDTDKGRYSGDNNQIRLVCARIIPLLAATVATIVMTFAVRDSILLLNNPEYYAIQDLLRSIMRGGQL